MIASTESISKMSETTVCRNCSTNFEGNFCNECGQQRFDERQFDFIVALKEFGAEIFDIESRLGRTLRTLVLQPGLLTIDYLKGRQRSYVSPIKLYVIVITINFLVYAYLEDYSLVNFEVLKNVYEDVPFLKDTLDIKIDSRGISEKDYYHLMNERINGILPVLLYLLIFLQALVLKLQFYGSDRYYIEHFVFALHFMAFGFLRDIVILPIQMWSSAAGVIITVTTTFAYLFVSLKKCYQLSTFHTVLHSAIHYTLFFILFFCTVLASIIIALSQ